MRFHFIRVVILTFFCLGFNVANAISSDVAQQFVENTSSRVMSVLESGKDDNYKQSQLMNIFYDVMDVDWIAKFVLGQYWNSLTSDQRVSYIRNYRIFIAQKYVPLFKDYNGQRFKIGEIKDLGADQFVVATIIQNSNTKSEYKVEYRVKYVDSKFKVRDIIAEGVSMLTTQRSDFSSIMTSSGFDQLLIRLHNPGQTPAKQQS